MNWAVVAAKLATRSAAVPSGCIEWSRGRDWDGYGVVRVEGVQYRAHRLAWSLAHRRRVPPGLVVRHACDNPPCINPDHLLLGTNADNVHDRESRGRSADRRGELCPTAKLTWPQVIEIRVALAKGESHTSLAGRYGVSRKAISKIANHTTWRTASCPTDS